MIFTPCSVCDYLTEIGTLSFLFNNQLAYVFLDEGVMNIAADAFAHTNITGIVVSNKIDLRGQTLFNDYKGNIYLDTETRGFNLSSNDYRNVYLKGQWTLVDGIPVPKR